MFLESDPAADALKSFQKAQQDKQSQTIKDTTARTQAISQAGHDPAALIARSQGLKPPTGDLRMRARAMAGGAAPQPSQTDNVQTGAQPSAVPSSINTSEGANQQMDALSELRESASSRYRETLTKTQTLEKQLKTNFEPLMEMVGGLDEETQGKLVPFLKNMFGASGYDNNAGNSLSKDEQRAMEAARDELINLDGRQDGKPNAQKSRDFVNSRRILKDQVSDDMIARLQKALPKGHRFKGKGNTSRLKRIVEQGGLDAYTGLPLDLNSSNWEHTIPNSTRYFENLSDNEKAELLKHVDSDDNMVEINKAPNQQKLKKSMAELYETVIDQDKNLTDEELMFRTDTLDKERRGLKDTSGNLVSSLFGEDGKFREGLSREDYDSVLESIDTETSSVKEGLLKGLTSLDADKLLSAKPGKLNDRDKVRRQALMKMKGAIGGLKSKSSGALLKSLGMNETIRDAKDERGAGLGHDGIVSAVMKSLVGKGSDEQGAGVEKWNELLKSTSKLSRDANAGGRLQKSSDRNGVQFSQYSNLVQGLRGLISEDVLGEEGSKGLSQWMDLFDGSDERKSLYSGGGLKALKNLMKESFEEEDEEEDMDFGFGGGTDIFQINEMIREFMNGNFNSDQESGIINQ
jgi:hypothetical protein